MIADVTLRLIPVALVFICANGMLFAQAPAPLQEAPALDAAAPADESAPVAPTPATTPTNATEDEDANAVTAATNTTVATTNGTLPSGRTASVAVRPLKHVRDPFWPIGWSPPPPEASDDPAELNRPNGPIRWEEATRRLSVTGLTHLSGGRYIATIKNVGVVEAGDRISLEFEGLIYQWEVQTITDKGIVPRRLGISAQRGN